MLSDSRNIELGVNTKFVLELPRVKQVRLEHAKTLRRCERWLVDPPPPPPLGMTMLTDSLVFFLKASLTTYSF